MSLPPGTRLGPYEITAAIGAGGMGEVYRAHDTRLDRAVAVKVLRAELSGDADGRARFEREARSVAALNHPNICTLHDVGNQDAVEFLVMELLDGETLAERLARGPLPSAEALALAVQIAEGLAHAHLAGIVHRDLKPANIMLTRSGVKLLDFGLAKLYTRPEAHVHGSIATHGVTIEGQIVGTLQYMAPEQLEGRPVDARTDVFAFGAILYEMLTGRRAFDQPSQAGLIGAILHQPAPLLRDAAVELPAVERLLAACLCKDPRGRWSTAHDVLLVLKAPAETATSSTHGTRRGPGRVWWGALAAIALSALAVVALMSLRTRDAAPSKAPLIVGAVLPEEGTTLVQGEAPQISPDGRLIAFVAIDRSGQSAIYVRRRDRARADRLAGTEAATLPFWAPDSRRLGFFADGQLKTVSLDGGQPETIARAPVPRGASWSVRDTILFIPIPSQPPRLVPARGGDSVAVPVRSGPDEGRWFPAFLPDGRHYVYVSLALNRGAYSLKLGSIDSTETRELIRSRSSGKFVAPGYLVFNRESTLLAQRFDPERGELSGEAIVIAQDVGYNPVTYESLFSSSATGVLAFQQVAGASELVWFDRQGKRLARAVPAGGYNSVCLTPDDRRAVFDFADPGTRNVDIWSLETATGRTNRLTFDPSIDFYPVCSPVPDQVLFATLREGAPDVYRVALAAPGSEQPFFRAPGPQIPTDVTAQGVLVYSTLNAAMNWDVAMKRPGDTGVIPLAATPAEERNGRLSPDGRWLAYMSNESGPLEVYVLGIGGGGTRWQVTRGGGLHPLWRRDGRELYYLTIDRKLAAVDVIPRGAALEFGPPHMLVDARVTSWERSNQGSPFAATASGDRFLVITATEAVRPITTVDNWPAAFTR